MSYENEFEKSDNSNFKDEFLKKCCCDNCGQSGNWGKSEWIVDDDGCFRWSGQCGYCKQKSVRYSNMKVNITDVQDNSLKGYQCPYCGANKVRHLHLNDIMDSVSFWGLSSPKVYYSYICDECKKMWK